jgi:hypothetical protein
MECMELTVEKDVVSVEMATVTRRPENVSEVVSLGTPEISVKIVSDHLCYQIRIQILYFAESELIIKF